MSMFVQPSGSPPLDEVTIVHVQVCILTLHRPHLLKLAIESLSQQSIQRNNLLLNNSGFPKLRVGLHILIVDNDVARSAETLAMKSLSLLEASGRYVCEPERGLSSARNRALNESSGMDFVVFLDDDETAQPDWLEHLLLTAIDHQADVVSGPVEPLYSHSPEWVVKGGFFKAHTEPTGTALQCAATNNTLLTSKVAEAFRFDRRFDQTGGEDTEFFLRVRRAGHRIVWSNEARVVESIPNTRANTRWILKRAWSDANRYTLGMLVVEKGTLVSLRRFAVACGGFLAGCLMLPRFLLGWHHGVRGLQLMCRAAGTFSALVGQTNSYYANVP